MKKPSVILPLAHEKEQTLAEAKPWLAGQKEKLREEFLKTGNAAAYVTHHAQLIDRLLASLYHACTKDKTRVALVAMGGYGRAELFPYSDIDLLFLYGDGQDREAARIAEFVLYVLWDMGLKIGHAHRSIDDTLALAKTDMEVRTALLDARFITGARAPFNRFWSRFNREIVNGTALEFVEAKLSERDTRHQKFGDSRYRLEPNVKEGKGGLRDLHTLWWLARYVYPIATLKDLVKKKRLTAEEYRTFDQARQFLWRVRTHLHLMAGYAEERLTFDRQHALAVAMGYPHPDPNRATLRFMKRYFAAVRTVGALTRIFCALLEEEKKRRPRKSPGWLKAASWALGNFTLEGERLTVKNARAFTRNPVLMLELFQVAQAHDLDIHPKALHLVARNLPRIDHKVKSDPKANAVFLDILLSYKGPETALRRMSEAGVLARFIPDFGRIIGQSQFDMYHVYTVDEHTLVALGILSAIEKGLLKAELPLASEVIHRITLRRALYLALFCHDIAKGRGDDHSHLGELLTLRLARRLGFSDDEAETTAWLVRNHLLFSNTVFKRDLNDPKTVADFIAAVKTPERLKLLLVLTAADIRAVGPAVWNAWKGALMRELYQQAELAMGTGRPELPRQEIGTFKELLQAACPQRSGRDIQSYIDQAPAGFLPALFVAQHAVIVGMLEEARAMALPLVIHTGHNPARNITEIIVCAFDQHGLFSKLAGAMSLAGANIISAKIFTLKSGMVVDIFHVQDLNGALFDDVRGLAKMTRAIGQALTGELDFAGELARRRRDRGRRRIVHPVPGQVFIENDASNLHTVIEISGQDRIGFLYQVTRAIADLGLSIASAHISTHGAHVADVFYVKDLFGMKVRHEGKLTLVRESLLQAVNEG